MVDAFFFGAFFFFDFFLVRSGGIDRCFFEGLVCEIGPVGSELHDSVWAILNIAVLSEKSSPYRSAITPLDRLGGTDDQYGSIYGWDLEGWKSSSAGWSVVVGGGGGKNWREN